MLKHYQCLVSLSLSVFSFFPWLCWLNQAHHLQFSGPRTDQTETNLNQKFQEISHPNLPLDRHTIMPTHIVDPTEEVTVQMRTCRNGKIYKHQSRMLQIIYWNRALWWKLHSHILVSRSFLLRIKLGAQGLYGYGDSVNIKGNETEHQKVHIKRSKIFILDTKSWN